jgi:hypothetical protein
MTDRAPINSEADMDGIIHFAGRCCQNDEQECRRCGLSLHRQAIYNGFMELCERCDREDFKPAGTHKEAELTTKRTPPEPVLLCSPAVLPGMAIGYDGGPARQIVPAPGAPDLVARVGIGLSPTTLMVVIDPWPGNRMAFPMGIVAAVIADEVSVETSGMVTLTTDQWDAVTGGKGGLIPGTAYYLSTTQPGHLTDTPPMPERDTSDVLPEYDDRDYDDRDDAVVMPREPLTNAIYLITATTGAWSDKSWWVVTWRATREEAEQFCVRLRREARDVHAWNDIYIKEHPHTQRWGEEGRADREVWNKAYRAALAARVANHMYKPLYLGTYAEVPKFRVEGHSSDRLSLDDDDADPWEDA